MRGKEAVRGAFQQARAEGRAALVLYWPLGYPDLETSIAVVVALAQAGADALELGVPFSDPLADGPCSMGCEPRPCWRRWLASVGLGCGKPSA